ncbi:hypothetical protein PoB_004242700 [Plakobranchus ocellatus]|uniref:Uncharacterized protein n=1 Tax=Plakobranchus ocellatus TaxID=259542 RepID=A0AAV4B911_9GAST|nr:hypothetical protein PoB_004242700 [Plakobranchus ocellatus]
MFSKKVFRQKNAVTSYWSRAWKPGDDGSDVSRQQVAPICLADDSRGQPCRMQNIRQCLILFGALRAVDAHTTSTEISYCTFRSVDCVHTSHVKEHRRHAYDRCSTPERLSRQTDPRMRLAAARNTLESMWRKLHPR